VLANGQAFGDFGRWATESGTENIPPKPQGWSG